MVAQLPLRALCRTPRAGAPRTVPQARDNSNSALRLDYANLFFKRIYLVTNIQTTLVIVSDVKIAEDGRIYDYITRHCRPPTACGLSPRTKDGVQECCVLSKSRFLDDRHGAQTGTLFSSSVQSPEPFRIRINNETMAMFLRKCNDNSGDVCSAFSRPRPFDII
ncbi:hypothetical protein EVAR_83210_1 [Eumeta japonica]|uniref:Uncharacterized protein n=1 Tax=Eumeta variegata TaxID=151549 RepID=A0A4C1YSX0_EUMVA|nr:hypothetical protein EVAR_83210_1 [Eumeta japonica]